MWRKVILTLMVKAVFFDFYNTLVRFYPPREQTQIAAGRLCGLELDPEGIVRGYVEADRYMTEQNSRLHIQKMSPGDRLAFFARYEQRVLRGGGVDASLELAGRVWAKVREQPYGLAPFDDAAPTLRTLKGWGLVVGLISNIYQDLDALCERMGFTPYLDFTVTSRSAGAEKPHAPIFLAALARAKVQPGEAIHIGDQYGGDVVGARGVGIRPVLLDREGLLGEHTDVERIRGLSEVVGLVG